MALPGCFTHSCHLLGPSGHFEEGFSRLQHKGVFPPPHPQWLVTSSKVKALGEGKIRLRWSGWGWGEFPQAWRAQSSLLPSVNGSGPRAPPARLKRKGGPQSSVIWPLDPGDKEPDFNSRKDRDHGLFVSFGMHDHFLSVPTNSLGLCLLATVRAATITFKYSFRKTIKPFCTSNICF